MTGPTLTSIGEIISFGYCVFDQNIMRLQSRRASGAPPGGGCSRSRTTFGLHTNCKLQTRRSYQSFWMICCRCETQARLGSSEIAELVLVLGPNEVLTTARTDPRGRWLVSDANGSANAHAINIGSAL
ncbi:hypothetical protein EVAR_80832_1 [Eumeta japonica]|uniref:Uncharacterized protein n=1 Tax=Eumeta variegata TaxID=151549 RepID=A0A4C1WG83_EUMVA|nr:hypothetical protein EVAR_80832_1 [Eumeta japonica]